MTTEVDYLALTGDERVAVEFENRMLSAPKATMPQCARDVLDGRGASSAYWAWLVIEYVAAELARRVEHVTECSHANAFELPR